MEALESETLTTSGIYNELPDIYVIFLCTFDPFRLGRHIYTFRNTCDESDGLKLNDGAVTIFLNTRGKFDDISGELKAFLDFMMGKASRDPFVMELEERVKIAKLNAKWRRVYMLQMLHEWEILSEGINKGFETGLAEGHTKGLAEGRSEGRSEMLNDVVEYLKSEGMNSEQIDRLRNSLSKR